MSDAVDCRFIVRKEEAYKRRKVRSLEKELMNGKRLYFSERKFTLKSNLEYKNCRNIAKTAQATRTKGVKLTANRQTHSGQKVK